MKKNILFAFILIVGSLFGSVAVSKAEPQAPPTNFYFMPMIGANPARSIFGAEITASNIPVNINSAVSGGIYWARINGLLWSEVQPNSPADWQWQNTSLLEAHLTQITSAGAQPILIIRSTPSWAQSNASYYGYKCGPMNSGNIANFANFVKEAVKRFSAPPYGVTYYELWNEPDVDPSQALGDGPYGCWGNYSDPYFGGGYYGQMLKQVYPAIKAANPNAQVLIGGLLMDCNPNNCPAGKYVNSGKFFEGILKSGAGAYFDLANFHGYTHFLAGNNPIALEINNYPKWPNGGVVQGKINSLRGVMTTYGVNKTIFETEAALIYQSSSTTAEYDQAKADYVTWVFTRNMAEGLAGTIWFVFDGPGWFNGGLVDQNLNPLPGYNALKVASHNLVGAVYKGPVTAPAGLTGFAFTREAKEVWALFSTDGSAHDFTVPAGILAAYDEFGAPITPSAGVISVTHPVWIETTP